MRTNQEKKPSNAIHRRNETETPIRPPPSTSSSSASSSASSASLQLVRNTSAIIGLRPTNQEQCGRARKRRRPKWTEKKGKRKKRKEKKRPIRKGSVRRKQPEWVRRFRNEIDLLFFFFNQSNKHVWWRARNKTKWKDFLCLCRFPSVDAFRRRGESMDDAQGRSD